MTSRLFHALAVITLLASCAGGPAEPQLPLQSPALTKGWIEGENGTRMRLTTWPAKGQTDAIILAIHGYGDNGAQTFGQAAPFWATQGITTYAYDQRGFGYNDSYRKWPGADVLIADLRTIAAKIRTRHPGVPITVTGHSMGGGITLAAAGRGLQADRLVLAGPAIVGGQEVNPLYRIVGWALGVTIPDKRFTGDGLVHINPTDNRDALIEAVNNPRRISEPSARELYGLVRLMDAAEAVALRVHQPTLTLMGSKDEIFTPEQVKRIHVGIPGAQEFVLYPEGWHWLFRDLQAKSVWREVAEFALQD